MLDLPARLLIELRDITGSLDNVESVTEYFNTEQVLRDLGKTHFDNAAIYIGDVELDRSFFARGNDLNKYKLEMIYCYKRTQGRYDVENNITKICERMRGNNFSNTQTTLAEISFIDKPRMWSEDVFYRSLILNVNELERTTDFFSGSTELSRGAWEVDPADNNALIPRASTEFEQNWIIDVNGDITPQPTGS